MVADRIRESIETCDFKIDSNGAVEHLTVTIGISSFPDKSAGKKELIDSADLALYKGKSSGKNRVIVYTDALK